jgi:hypothetical protein
MYKGGAKRAELGRSSAEMHGRIVMGDMIDAD